MLVTRAHNPAEPDRRRPWIAAIIVALALFVGAPAGLYFCAWLVTRNMFYNCTERSPLLPFHTYLGVVPPGVSDIRSAGAVGLGGSEIFLRFRATNAAVAALAKSFGPEERESDANQLETWDGQFDRGWLQNQGRQPFEHQVHWEELRRLRHPHVYGRKHSETSWDMLIWDPENQRAYFYHMNI